MLKIQELLGEDYLKRFKVYNPSLLFEPNWEALKQYRCPICGNLLKFPRDKGIGICNGVKHRKSFVISNKKLFQIVFPSLIS